LQFRHKKHGSVVFLILLSLTFLLSNNAYSFDILKTDYQTHSLQTADINNDGNIEIIVANSYRGSIDCYYSGKSKTEDLEKIFDENKLNYDLSWTLKSIPVEHAIYGLLVKDLNHDGKVDFMYHGTPENLIILFQKEDGQFSAPHEIEIKTGLKHTQSMISRKIKDNRTEVIIQHDMFRTHLILDKNGKVEHRSEVTNLHSSRNLFRKMFWGNWKKQKGLWVMLNNNTQPLLFYPQISELRYDFPNRIKVPQTRLLVSGHFKNSANLDFIQVRTRKGQLFELDFYGPETPGNKKFPYAPSTIPYNRSGSKSFHSMVSDIDNNGSQDLILAHRESAQIEIYLSENGNLLPSSIHPSYRKINFMHTNGEDVQISSQSEGLSGLAKYRNKRMAFPKAIENKEKVLFFVHLKTQNSNNTLSVIEKDKKAHLIHKDQALAINLPSPFPKNALATFLTGKKHPELILEIPYQGIKIFSWDDQKKQYEDLTTGISFLKNEVLADLTLNSIAFIHTDKSTDLSLATGQLIRRYRFFPKVEIITQINLPRPGAMSSLHNYVDLNKDGSLELISYDGDSGKLDFFEKANTDSPLEWQQTLNSNKGCQQLKFLIHAKGQSPDIILLGSKEFQWFRHGKNGPDRPHSNELNIEDSKWQYTNQAYALPLDKDGKDHICLIDSNRHYMRFFHYENDKWHKDQSFPIFEEKSYRRSSKSSGPRQIISAKLHKDNSPSILLLIHNRILIYDR